MTVQYYPNGIGGTAPGDSLDLARPLMTTGNIWYVSSLIGTDAVSPAGQNREKPLATVAQAITNALDDDIVVFLPGHTQTLTALQSVAKSLTFVGEGTVGGKPAVSFLMNAANQPIFTVSVAGVEFRNLYFPPNVQANSAVKITYSAGGSDAVIRGCLFECGATDLDAALSFLGSRMRIESSTFVSVATLLTAQPFAAMRASGAITGVTIRDVVVSAGTVGFSNYAAISFASASISLLRVEGLSLLLGADANFGAGTITGRVNVQLATGGSRVAWS